MKKKSIVVNNIPLTLEMLKGTVLEIQKNSETSGYSANIETQILDTVFLEDENGKEHSIQLSNIDVPCRRGHILVVASIFKQNSETGNYVAVRNISTDKIKIKDEILDRFFPTVSKMDSPSTDGANMKIGVYSVVLIVGALIGIWIVDSVDGLVRTTFGMSLPFITAIIAVIIFRSLRKKSAKKVTFFNNELRIAIQDALNEF